MFIEVVHTISDKSVWTERLAEFERQGAPPRLTLHYSGTANDGTKAFCLWEAPSVEAVSSFLDDATAGAAQNSYYTIDENAPATRLPRSVVASS